MKLKVSLDVVLDVAGRGRARLHRSEFRTNWHENCTVPEVKGEGLALIGEPPMPPEKGLRDCDANMA